MTGAGKALSLVYVLALVIAVSLAGQYLGAARWLHATAGYTVAALCLCGLIREVGRAIPPGEYTEDLGEEMTVGEAYDPDRPQTRPMGRLRAARTARRAVQDVGCGCNLYWATAGAAHDEWCPRHDWSAV